MHRYNSYKYLTRGVEVGLVEKLTYTEARIYSYIASALDMHGDRALQLGYGD